MKTQEQITSLVGRYEIPYQKDDPASGYAWGFFWEEVPNFDLSLLGEAEGWINWYEDEKDSERAAYFLEMEDWWLLYPEEEPVVLIEGTNGTVYIWDGCHRIAISRLYHWQTIPAYYGRRIS